MKNKVIVTSPLYAVKCNGVFWAPIAENKLENIIATFAFAINSTDSPLYGHEKVTDLYRIGEFNSKLGKLKSVNPVLIRSGVSVKIHTPLVKPEVKKDSENLVTHDYEKDMLEGKCVEIPTLPKEVN